MRGSEFAELQGFLTIVEHGNIWSLTPNNQLELRRLPLSSAIIDAVWVGDGGE
jgi:hypothetical protein